MAELVSASVVRPRDLGSKLEIEKKYFLILLVSSFEFKFEGH
jgi:hypothetical protein